MDNYSVLTETPNAPLIVVAVISFCVIVVLLVTRRGFLKWYVVYVFSILIFLGSIGMLIEGPDEYEMVSMTGQVTEKRVERGVSGYPPSSWTAHIIAVDGKEFVLREPVYDWLERGESVIVKYQIDGGDKNVIRVEKLNHPPTDIHD